MRPLHRIRQFCQALTIGAGPAAPLELAPALRQLFLQMPPADRAHALRTYRLLAAAEERPAELLTAALLHDLGKCSSQVRLWDRVLFVLARKLAPGWLEGLPEGPHASCWAGLITLQTHAERGAQLAAAAGATPRTVNLIRWHHADADGLGWPEGERRLLEALQRADELS